MPERVEFQSTAITFDQSGIAQHWPFKASHSRPTHEDGGMLTFSWTAVIEGVDQQPEPRTTILEARAAEIAPDFVKRYIEREVVAHLGAIER